MNTPISDEEYNASQDSLYTAREEFEAWMKKDEPHKTVAEIATANMTGYIMQAMQEEIDDLKQQLDAARAENTELRDTLKDNERAAEFNYAEWIRQTHETEQLKTAIVTLTARNQTLQNDLKAAQDIIVDAGKQVEALRDTISLLRDYADFCDWLHATYDFKNGFTDSVFPGAHGIAKRLNELYPNDNEDQS